MKNPLSSPTHAPAEASALNCCNYSNYNSYENDLGALKVLSSEQSSFLGMASGIFRYGSLSADGLPESSCERKFCSSGRQVEQTMLSKFVSGNHKS